MKIENVDVKKIDINEIHHPTVQQRALMIEHTVKNTVNQIADGSAENQRESETKSQSLRPHGVEKVKNAERGNNRKK